MKIVKYKEKSKYHYRLSRGQRPHNEYTTLNLTSKQFADITTAIRNLNKNLSEKMILECGELCPRAISLPRAPIGKNTWTTCNHCNEHNKNKGNYRKPIRPYEAAPTKIKKKYTQ